MRRVLIAGNWKLNGTIAWAKEFAAGMKAQNNGNKAAEVCLCPTFTSLYALGQELAGSGIALGAQDIFWKDSGAYTSQVSAPMLQECGVSYVIIGHSETRGRYGVPEPDFTPEVLKHFGETDTTVNMKAHYALANGLKPIICCGETLEEREAGKADTIIADQVTKALKDFTGEQAATLVFAYEPVWAIGTGKTCDTAEANRICGIVRSTVAKCCGSAAAEGVRVLYGGSVKPSNAKELLATSDIDGALVGGASMKVDSFTGIIDAA